MKILSILASVLLNCAAQLLIRKGMMQIGEVSINDISQHFTPMITNLCLWAAMICYSLSVLLWMSVLSKVEVSYAYPFLSIGFIISAVAGYAFFNENISPIRIVGIVVICIGVIMISRS